MAPRIKEVVERDEAPTEMVEVIFEAKDKAEALAFARKLLTDFTEYEFTEEDDAKTG